MEIRREIAMKKTSKDELAGAIYETAMGIFHAGLMSKSTMCEFNVWGSQRGCRGVTLVVSLPSCSVVGDIALWL